MKKVLSVLLAVLLLMTAVPLGAFSMVVGAEAPAPTIRVESAYGYAGDTVDVTVYMENNPGLIGWLILLEYDESVLTLTNYVAGDAFAGVGAQSTGPKTSPFSVLWYDGINPNNTGSGALYTVSFAINEGADAGYYPVRVYTEWDDDCINDMGDAVIFDMEDGFVQVCERVSGVWLDYAVLDTKNGLSTTLIPTITPSTAFNQAVTWESSDPSVATVSPEGVVRGVHRGTATVTVTTMDGGFTASCIVNVTCRELVHYAAVQPTHFEGGNLEFWQCNNCGTCYTDPNGIFEASYYDLLLDVIPHEYAEEWSMNENEHWRECECGDIINWSEHYYDNACDAVCDCGWVREVPPHVYDGLTDGYCNVCYATRAVTQFDLTAPYTRVYTYNTGVLDVTGGYVDIAYEDGAAGRVELTADMIFGFDNTLIGMHDLLVVVGSGSANYLVQVTEADALPTIRVQDVANVRAGETFTANVYIENNPGMISMRLALSYDTSKLELISAEGVDFADMAFGPVEKVPFIVNWTDALNPNNSTDGVFVKLTFQVKADAEVGQTPITVSYDTDDLFDYDLETVLFNCASGQVNVISYISGDLNRDGRVTIRDLTLMQQILNKWDLTYDAMAADVTRDGRVNIRDLTLLQQYLNRWDVELK